MVPHMLLDTSRCEEATAVLASSILRRHLPLHFLNAAFLLLVFAAVEVVAATGTRQASAADIHLRPQAPPQARRSGAQRNLLRSAAAIRLESALREGPAILKS